MHSSTWNGIFFICLIAGVLIAGVGLVRAPINEREANFSIIPIFAVTGLLMIAAGLIYFTIKFFLWSRPSLLGSASPSVSAASTAAPSTTNTVQAGATLPLVLDLGGDLGTNILAKGYPLSTPMNCQNWSVGSIGPAVTAHGELHYNRNTGHYDYQWSTDLAWRGSCRELVFKFAQDVNNVSGGTVTLDFTFK